MIETDIIERVARFSINRPEKRNALNTTTCRQLLECLDRDEALKYGIVTQFANDPKVKALEVATKLSQFSPIAMAAGLEHIARTRNLDWDDAAPINREIRGKLMASDDFKEGVSAFLEKREP